MGIALTNSMKTITKNNYMMTIRLDNEVLVNKPCTVTKYLRDTQKLTEKARNNFGLVSVTFSPINGAK